MRRHFKVEKNKEYREQIQVEYKRLYILEL